jgi:hypothetical protein
MDPILHFFGICPDHMFHINIIDYLKFIPMFSSFYFVYWKIKLVLYRKKNKIE